MALWKEGPMDIHVDEKIYNQIEKNLNNNINQNLFSSGRELEVEQKLSSSVTAMNTSNVIEEQNSPTSDYLNSNSDYINSSPALSRAEYIKQAREACLRQLSAMQSSHPFEVYQSEAVVENVDQISKKKSMSLLKEKVEEEESEQEIVAFRSLMIRTICAVVIFLSLFVFDKLEVKLGGFSYEVVREYVTGNNQLEALENIFVSFLK